MNEEIRCAECGARNKADADWCSQCFTPFGAPPAQPDPPAAAPSADAPLPPTPDAAAPTAQSPVGEDGQLRSGDGRFRQTDDGLEWICRVCQEWNPIERVTCNVCSSPFGTDRDDTGPVRPDVAPGVLIASSLVLPGAGHWLLELRGTAVLRAFLAVVWGLGGLTLWLQASSSGQPVLPAIPLLLGWLMVAAGSANDALVEGGGSGQRVLDGRFLLWLTTGVVGGTFAAVLFGVMSAVR